MAGKSAAPGLQAALGVRRTSGIYIGWTLGQILRFAHWHEGIDYLQLLAGGVRLYAESAEREAAYTIVGHLGEVPVLDEIERARELEKIEAIGAEWRP